ncbi:MAG TPA: TlpA disulfide reductase family protein [Bryobacteraceae bacterium]|nr:TlpA disulfide reductase family protein [Bryobacteraceae bacterium]
MRTVALCLLSAAIAFSAAVPDTVRQSPAFSIQRIGNAPIDVNHYHGKIVALAFISTTCPHCQHLTEVLNTIEKEYTPRGVQFLECAFNPDAQSSLPQFIQQFHPAFPVGYADRGSVLAYLQYSILDTKPVYVPHMVFLDRRGMIRGDYPGESDFFQNPDASIRNELNQLLKPAAAATHRKKR